MTPGLSVDLEEVSDIHKTAVISNRLGRLRMDIITLQETRLSSFGSIRNKDFSFFWQEKLPDEIREHGVGFAIRSSLICSIVSPTEGTERLLKFQLQTLAGLVSCISAYAPSLASSPEAKFFDKLSAAISEVPLQEPLFIFGDFNARDGASNSSWSSCLGQFGMGKMKKKGQHLLELCHHGLCITKHWHQFDLILTRCSRLDSVKLTCSHQSADCNTDHSLMCSKVNLQSRRFHYSKMGDHTSTQVR